MYGKIPMRYCVMFVIIAGALFTGSGFCASDLETRTTRIVAEFEDMSYKTCLYTRKLSKSGSEWAIDEERQECAEGNLASFFRKNEPSISTLYELGVLGAHESLDIDREKIRNNQKTVSDELYKIWHSQTNIAVDSRKQPEEFARDLKDFADLAWSDGYTVRSEELAGVDDVQEKIYTLYKLMAVSYSSWRQRSHQINPA